ncbi:hypothetical protein DI392_16180 [Vibrio albus]|uniref:Retropepsin-like aspartic endopeptidase domain-containing protein n=1 Tax=Vibrio albus TaxID=2200953 RepID=A0A2U3B670_9VIBR|nr:RimK/LysX family protein [Vibrio albus]PWI32215.1 hypothetical protein DI392_16180 [Vibrio albus]
MGHLKSLLSVFCITGLVACGSPTTLSDNNSEIDNKEPLEGPLTASELAEVADLQMVEQKHPDVQEPVVEVTPKRAETDPGINNQEVTRLDEPVAELISDTQDVEKAEMAESVQQTIVSQPLSDAEESAPSVVVSVQDNQYLFGSQEWAYLPGVSKSFVAEVNPDIDLSLIHVTDMNIFERNGKEWVTFSLGNETGDKQSEMNLPVTVWLEKRPVVATWVQVGELTDRINFVLMKKLSAEEVLVLGKNFFNDKVVVDPGRQYIQTKK